MERAMNGRIGAKLGSLLIISSVLCSTTFLLFGPTEIGSWVSNGVTDYLRGDADKAGSLEMSAYLWGDPDKAAPLGRDPSFWMDPDKAANMDISAYLWGDPDKTAPLEIAGGPG
jgi:hypothetical protein